MTNEEMQDFRIKFHNYCQQEVKAGHCPADTCEFCPITDAYEKIFGGIDNEAIFDTE